MIVVADTSPINYLILIGHIDVLKYFYGRVFVPPAVWDELRSPDAPEQVRAWVLHAPDWIGVRELRHEPDAELQFLDRGEREAIALAEEVGANRLIADETLARDEAVRRGLPVIGTLGVLRNAARANLLLLPDVLEALQKTSFHVSQSLIRSSLEEDRQWQEKRK